MKSQAALPAPPPTAADRAADRAVKIVEKAESILGNGAFFIYFF